MRNAFKVAGASALLALATVAIVAAWPRISGRIELSHTFDSPDALARRVLDSLAHRDAADLRRLALSAHEFRYVVWPELPMSQGAYGFPADYAWGDLNQKSLGYLATTLHRYGGQRFELEGVEFEDGRTAYESFVVHRKATLIVRDESGQRHELRLFGSVVERSGRYKLFSFVADD